MRRFSTARDDHTGAMFQPAGWHLNRRCQMHKEAYRTDCTLGVVHQAHQLPQRRLAAEVDDTVEWRMMVRRLTDLHKLYPSAKVVDDLLISSRIPPLDGEVVLAT